MMGNEVKVFSNGKIDLPVKEIDGQVYFDAEAAAIGLGLTDSKENKAYVRWARVRNYLNSPQVAKGSWITEQQFYKLAFKANNTVAEAFQDWVAGEVLPAIRKHGVYMTDQKAYDLVNNKDSLIDLLEQAANQLKQKDIQISEMKPKALFADSVASSETTILIGVLTVELFRNYNESQERFINVLLKHVDQNVCDIKQLSESCGQIDDLGIEVKVCQEHVNHTMDMIEELKAKRSMDILDKLREKDKE
ncbi:MAG: hypothetical protein DQL93_04910 [Lactobacillus delbrueckii subsp. lactis]|uniref:Bro-N domain-containing protein n=1 Tax=Lactobacillus delbrueckii subsp. lactis TaxID=29397 RepID=A0A3G6JG61_LACDL|nr:MAG: hypothetical protein DQL93_04910 [Lactobacillus delbrueckii subsp. lactis]